MSALYFVVGFLVFAVLGVTWVRSSYQSSRAVARFASRHGLQYLGTSGIDLPRYDFPLLHQGDKRGCKNVLAGRWEGLPVKEADFWYSVVLAGERGGDNVSILIADLPACLPGVLIDKKSLSTKAAEHLGAGHIDFSSKEFNRKFQVTAPDTGFAVS